ncbi:MAG: hypothetical protein ACJAWV_002520 [Flammeovirgaceae bacterium]|jgi:hypothetical protein
MKKVEFAKLSNVKGGGCGRFRRGLRRARRDGAIDAISVYSTLYHKCISKV